MKRRLSDRLLAFLLAFALCVGLALPASAVGSATKISFERVDNNAVSVKPSSMEEFEEPADSSGYKDTDKVRVSIVLKDKSTLEAFADRGDSVEDIADNDAAMRYRENLESKQARVARDISDKVLDDESLDVVWNLTLAANIISAEVEYGQIEAIEAIPGVAQVLIETKYLPAVVDSDLVNDPNMSTSTAQIGSGSAWAAGYTGAGSRIAIIDTGVDPEHQSFSGEGLEYSLARQAESRDMDVDAYMASLDLLDAEEIESVLPLLNVKGVSGEDLYCTTKIAYGYNYIDEDLDISHVNDREEEHGGHVAGIATANAYVPDGEGSYAPAIEKVKAQGVAPDAQLMVMKVFGKGGGAYDSDYMAAIEDAILLGADSINLSLGSGNAGMARNATAEYQQILDNLEKCGTVVAMSAGNAGNWAEQAAPLGYLYDDGVSLHTGGSPGSYTNSLCVASVDNAGYTGAYLTVGETPVFYTQTTGYANQPMSTIAGEHEYILIEGFGTPEDFAAVGDALKGKVALCSRGETSFYQKGDAAAEAGAIATIIYNNQAGSINMDLSDYSHPNPCVSVTQAEGAMFKEMATPVTDEEGNVLYYQGTLVVADGIGSAIYDVPFQTMSAFSSWGVPGTLQMKPEITAPGGNIYSVNGYHQLESGAGYAGGHDAYENMSGTSMASPQVAGMAAVAAQYIREAGLVEKTGQDARTLAQSLLMSTAVPLMEDQDGASGYYSILSQGAGLANVGAAVTADSYILMGEDATVSASDGKVKAELGDDPEKCGSYTFSFRVYNLTGEERSYELRADLFTQDLFPYYVNQQNDVGYYMDTWTTPMAAAAEWTVDGKVLGAMDESLRGMDFNGDGRVSKLDADALMEYVVGNRHTIAHMDRADLDGNGEINTHDVYEFLTRLSTGTVRVPADGSAEVSVTLTLTDAQKELLDAYYPTGAYVEGYAYVKTLSTEEGAEGTQHSIPILGYYGCWSDPSMFDVGTQVEYEHGEEVRIPYLGNEKVNAFGVSYADDPGPYYFGGNPLVPDAAYMPERNAINSADQISMVSYASIRNAAAFRFQAVNETTGEVMKEAINDKPVISAYYYANGQTWRNTSASMKPAFSPKDAAEGDRLNVSFTLALEYYMDDQGNVDWDALGDGASMSMPMVVDNTAPEMMDVNVDMDAMTMTITASDNQYVAAVALFNGSGVKLYGAEGAKQDIQPGESAEYTLSLEGVNGKRFLVQVFDYAMNAATYKLEMQIGEPEPLPEMMAFDLDENMWITFTKESNVLEPYAPSKPTFFAATIVDHVVFASTDEGALYAMPEDDLTEMTKVCDLGVVLSDMAYNKADGQIYAVASGYLLTIDRYTGEWEVVEPIGVQTNTLACDDEGTFYCNKYGTGMVYKFTIGSDPVLVCNTAITKSQYVQSMEFNSKTGMVCWNSFYVNTFLTYNLPYSYYIEIDPATGRSTRYKDLNDEISCLLIPDDSPASDWAAPTEEVAGMVISQDAVSVLRGSSVQLDASVQPWTVFDRSVTWISSDPSVASVDSKGNVTGVSAGTCTVTATSNLDPSFTAECEVTVVTMDVTLKGVLQDAEGEPQFFHWNMAEEDTWTGDAAIGTDLVSATMDTDRNFLYAMSGNAQQMHKIDPATGETVEQGGNAAGVPLWDMTYSSVFSTAETPKLSSIYYYYLLAPKDPMNLDAAAFNLSSRLPSVGASYLVAIASMGYERVEFDGKVFDTERTLMLDNAGNLWNFNIYATDGGGFSALLNTYQTNLDEEFPIQESMESPLTSMVVGDDGKVYLSAFDGETNNLYCIELDDEAGVGMATKIGDVGQDVWPAALYAVESNDEAAPTQIRTIHNAEVVTAQPVSTEEMEAAAYEMTMGMTVASAKRDDRSAKYEPATGSLNAVTAASSASKRPEAVEDEKTLVLDVTSKGAKGVEIEATNGKITVRYDAETLELVSARSSAEVFAYNDSQPGVVVLGYADTEAFASGAPAATLTFQRKNSGTNNITVSQNEANNMKPGYSEKRQFKGKTAVSNGTVASITVMAMVNGDVANATELFSGDAPKGVKLVDWLDANVKVDAPAGTKWDGKWMDDSGKKCNSGMKITDSTVIYVNFTSKKK